MRYILLVILSAILVSCNDDGGGGSSSNSNASSSGRNNLQMRLKSNGNSVSSISSLSADNAIPLLFGYIDVAAYYYRPNAADQSGNGSSQHTGDTWNSARWSRWHMIPSNEDGARDFILPTGGSLDLHAMNPTYFYADITQDFISNVGAFSMDVVMVTGTPSMINTNNDICGPWYLAVKYPSDFPSLNFNTQCAQRWIKSAYDGTFLWGRQILFIRKDWFSTPVQLHMYSDLGTETQCFTTDVPLSAFQAELIDSLLADIRGPQGWDIGHYSTSCAQRPQETISIVPQNSDVAVVQFSQQVVPQDPTITPEGNTVPTPPQTIMAQSVEMSLGFNLLPSMLVDYNSFNDSNAASDILVNRASNGSTWGMSVDFRAVTPAAAPP